MEARVASIRPFADLKRFPELLQTASLGRLIGLGRFSMKS